MTNYEKQQLEKGLLKCFVTIGILLLQKTNSKNCLKVT